MADHRIAEAITEAAQAEAAYLIEVLASRLAAGRVLQEGDPAIYCECAGAPEELAREGERVTAGLARRWSKRLLKAAQSNGLGGCRLCAS